MGGDCICAAFALHMREARRAATLAACGCARTLAWHVLCAASSPDICCGRRRAAAAAVPARLCSTSCWVGGLLVACWWPFVRDCPTRLGSLLESLYARPCQVPQRGPIPRLSFAGPCKRTEDCSGDGMMGSAALIRGGGGGGRSAYHSSSSVYLPSTPDRVCCTWADVILPYICAAGSQRRMPRQES